MKKTRESQPQDMFLCSELVTLSAGRRRLVGNLEEIERNRCSVLLDVPVTPGTEIRLECLACPRRQKGFECLKCHFAGRVEGQEEDGDLGLVTHIGFYGRRWSRKEWQPRHLTNPVLFVLMVSRNADDALIAHRFRSTAAPAKERRPLHLRSFNEGRLSMRRLSN